MAVFGWIGGLNLLGKSWSKSSSFVIHNMGIISSSLVSLSAPFDLIAMIVLGFIPSMVSLVIWVDVRVAIFHWISNAILLNQSSKWVSIWSNGL